MAASCARTLQLSSASAKSLLNNSSISSSSSLQSALASKATKFIGLASLKKPISTSKLSAQRLTFSRLPVELGGVLSVMPLHSVTASALFTSLLSLSNTSWGCLSEVHDRKSLDACLIWQDLQHLYSIYLQVPVRFKPDHTHGEN
ncbi:hypothetical protein CFOL_v3_25659 [Cephalotus follicularis]|uniref:Uncharacterized protein n=1 Tax=Cephalotus follicularis TaxID=3775 RepID=A0A1Q3CPQ1_CEPFO|nr:hypothetical protein CFOL_v3_25659 [Cephalotus follicularis]